MAHEALAGYAALMEKGGDVIPEPRTLAENYNFIVGFVTLLPLIKVQKG
jgi:hypothetical protein